MAKAQIGRRWSFTPEQRKSLSRAESALNLDDFLIANFTQRQARPTIVGEIGVEKLKARQGGELLFLPGRNN